MTEVEGKDSQAHLALIHSKLEGLGLPPHARDWLIKALHPAATHECPGVPDMYEGQIITPDYRDSVVVGPNAAVTGDWDLMVLQIPGDVNGFAYATGPSGVDFTLPITSIPSNTTTGATANQLNSAFSVGFIELTGTAITFPSHNSFQLQAQPWEWRNRYRGLTCYMTASALYDQGTVFASSFSSTFVRSGPIVDPNVVSGGSTPSLAVVHAFNLPLDETSLQLVSPKPYVAPARHGVYVPSRFLDFDLSPIEFVKNSDVVWPTTSGVNFLSNASGTPVPAITYPQFLNASGVPSWVSGAFTEARVAGNSQMDTNQSGMTSSIVIFRGLANQARITVRSYYGLEIVPTNSSTQRQFAKPAPAYSEVALRTYAAIQHELAYCFPASYNSWGDLLGVIDKVAKVLYPVVSPLLSKIPVVGGVVKTIGDAAMKLLPSAHPHMSEVQRVSTSDPRPPVKTIAPQPKPKTRRAAVCQQCLQGIPHKHKRAPSVRSRSLSLRRR